MVLFAKRTENQRAWLAASGLALLIMGFYLLLDTRSTLWDRDEPRFSRATVEMIESGNYLVPTFNGALRLHKPILVYWLMSIPMYLLGPTELACRCFGAVGTACTCLLTFFMAKRLFTPQVGLWAMTILSSSLMVLYMGSAATADAVLLPFMTAQMAVYVFIRATNPSGWTTLLMGISMGGALLAKGPVGLLPVLSILIMIWLDRDKRQARRQLIGLSLALVLASIIFLTWGIPANIATKGEFLRQGLGVHVLQRAARPMEHHGGRFLLYLPYYLPVIVIGFFPWILFLPGALSMLLGRRLGGQSFRQLFLAWTLPVLIVMTLVATKLPHYILSIWPIMAIASAAVLQAEQAGQLTEHDIRWGKCGLGAYSLLALGGILGLSVVPWFVDVPGLIVPSSLCALVLLGRVVNTVAYHRQGRVLAEARVLVIGSVLFFLPFLGGVLPAIEQIKIAPALGTAIKNQVAGDIPIATYIFEEPSLNFYVGRQLNHLCTEAEFDTWLDEWRPGVIVVPRDTLEQALGRHVPLNLTEIASKRGFNYAKGQISDVVVVQRQ